MSRKAVRYHARDYLVAGLLALALVWLVVLIFGIFRKEEIARHAAAETRAELATLEEREHTLQGTISELSTDRGQEATLRETYGVARPGEEVIIVVPGEEATTTLKLPWWKGVLGWFGIWK